MKKTIFYFIILSINMINIQSLSSQNTIDYWTFNCSTFTVQTKNSSNQTVNTKSYSLSIYNTFIYNNTTVYYRPQVLATYPSGEDALVKLIKANLKGNAPYNIIGIVSLIISSNGSVESIGIFQSCGEYTYDLQAINFLKSLSWTPAKQNGVTVRSILFVPVRFENL